MIGKPTEYTNVKTGNRLIYDRDVLSKTNLHFSDVFRDEISVVVPEMTASDVDDWEVVTYQVNFNR